MKISIFKKIKSLIYYYINTEKGKFELFHYFQLFIYGSIVVIFIEMII